MDPETCAAYVAAREALVALRVAVAGWPLDLAEHAHTRALVAISATAASLDHAHASGARRMYIRSALAAALDLSGDCEIAAALGHAVDPVRHEVGRAVAMLGLYLHASSPLWAED